MTKSSSTHTSPPWLLTHKNLRNQSALEILRFQVVDRQASQNNRKTPGRGTTSLNGGGDRPAVPLNPTRNALLRPLEVVEEVRMVGHGPKNHLLKDQQRMTPDHRVIVSYLGIDFKRTVRNPLT
jgi:hypothetical protein